MWDCFSRINLGLHNKNKNKMNNSWTNGQREKERCIENHKTFKHDRQINGPIYFVFWVASCSVFNKVDKCSTFGRNILIDVILKVASYCNFMVKRIFNRLV